MHNITVQYDLRPYIPNIYGHADYREFRDTLLKMDEILDQGGLEKELVDAALAQWMLEHQKDESFYQNRSYPFHWKNLQYALRCNIARHLTGESFRAFSMRLSDSTLFQWFVGIQGFASRKAVSKARWNVIANILMRV